MTLKDAVENAKILRERGAQSELGDALVTILEFAERLHAVAIDMYDNDRGYATFEDIADDARQAGIGSP